MKKSTYKIKLLAIVGIGLAVFWGINNLSASAGGSDGTNPVASVHMSQLRAVAKQVSIVKNSYCSPQKVQQKAQARFENNKTDLDAFLSERGVTPLSPSYQQVFNFVKDEYGACP